MDTEIPIQQETNESEGNNVNKDTVEVDVAIVGAGIAGLYCCHHLFEAYAEMDNTIKGNLFKEGVIGLFEASDRLGGRIESWRIHPKDFKQDCEQSPTDEERDAKDRQLLTDMIKDDKDIKDIKEQKHPKRLDDILVAEFGPMRIEPDHQPLLNQLLKDVRIETNDTEHQTWSDLIPFPPYAGEPPNEPEFHLEGEEAEQSTMIDLLLLALRRIFENITIKDVIDPNNPWRLGRVDDKSYPVPYDELNYFWNEMTNDSFLHRKFWKRHMRDWINCLRDEHYDFIRDHFYFKNTPLKDMGFWNIIASVLSHMATVKLRDWGSFYHLLNDNPNAVEWLIFWLRAIRSTNSLVGIRGGMDWIVIKLCEKLGIEFWGQDWDSSKTEQCVKPSQYKEESSSENYPELKLYCNTALREVEENDEHVILYFRQPKRESFFRVKARQVILALPKSPLQDIIFRKHERDNDKWNLAFRSLLDTVSVIPLLKCFVVVDNPFWEDDRPANRYAYTVPAREVHYWKTKDKGTGLLMIYTDRPGTEYWSNFLVDTFKEDSHKEDSPSLKIVTGKPPTLKSKDLKLMTRRQDCAKRFFWKNECPAGSEWDIQKFGNDRLLRTFFTYVRENHAESVPDNQVLAAGIRDWGLKPYEGACHAWRSGSDSKAIREYLKAFSTIEETPQEKCKLHVCGEAYSDYQGFIEGALRSAKEVLTGSPFKLPLESFSDSKKERQLCRTRNVLDKRRVSLTIEGSPGISIEIVEKAFDLSPGKIVFKGQLNEDGQLSVLLQPGYYEVNRQPLVLKMDEVKRTFKI